MNMEHLPAVTAWLGAIAFTFQIYFDFSGYSDMAIGLGKLLGFEFLENFNYPYIAKSITEFWRRWHISLSTWFKEYLYIPLGETERSCQAMCQHHDCVGADRLLARRQLELSLVGYLFWSAVDSGKGFAAEISGETSCLDTASLRPFPHRLGLGDLCRKFRFVFFLPISGPCLALWVLQIRDRCTF